MQDSERQVAANMADRELRIFIEQWRERHGLAPIEESLILHKFNLIAVMRVEQEGKTTGWRKVVIDELSKDPRK